MTAPLAKMQVFISYKRGDRNALNSQANSIRRFLEGYPEEYEVWMDTTDISAGDLWEMAIYKAIPRSDVILVPVAPETIESQWVRRELDLARRAQVCIIPLLVKGSDAELGPVLKDLGFEAINHLKLFNMDDTEMDQLKKAVDAKRGVTRENQFNWLTDFLLKGDQQAVQKMPAEPNPSRLVYTLPFHSCEIHLASGDLTKLSGIDVIVNPENNYLQMARIFEATSISSKIRVLGSKRSAAGHLIEDTVQIDLNDMARFEDYRIPISEGQVVPTHAGHPESELADEIGVRYLFHVVSVTVKHTPARQDQIRPIDDSMIEEAVENCLDWVIRLDANNGVFSPAGGRRRAEEEAAMSNYKPIESILLPMFATGQGTRQSQDDIKRVAGRVAKSVRNYLKTNSKAKKLNLKRIHICGYSDADVHIIKSQMDSILK